MFNKKERVSSLLRKDSRFVQGGRASSKADKIGWWERDKDIKHGADDDIVIVELPVHYNQRPDLLAYDLYGSNNFDWVILQYNTIIDVNEEFTTGKRIVAPSLTRLRTVIMNKTLKLED